MMTVHQNGGGDANADTTIASNVASSPASAVKRPLHLITSNAAPAAATDHLPSPQAPPHKRQKLPTDHLALQTLQLRRQVAQQELLFIEGGGRYLEYEAPPVRQDHPLIIATEAAAAAAAAAAASNDNNANGASAAGGGNGDDNDDVLMMNGCDNGGGGDDDDVAAGAIAAAAAVAAAKNENLFTPAPRRPLSPLTAILLSHDVDGASRLEALERRKAELTEEINTFRRGAGKRLPVGDEPPRNKAHWDYLLAEMEWMASDFQREKKLKAAALKRINRGVLTYFKKGRSKVDVWRRKEETERRRTAQTVTKHVKQFWTNVAAIARRKYQTTLEQKKQQSLDRHLEYLVGQTEQFTTQVAQKLAPSASPIITTLDNSNNNDDDDDSDDDDDDDRGGGRRRSRRYRSRRRRRVTPALSHTGKEIDINDNSSGGDNNDDDDDDGDGAFSADESSSDDEATLEQAEAEEFADKKGTQKELKELENEAEMSVEELYKKYYGDTAPEDLDDIDDDDDDDDDDDEEEEEENDNDDAAAEQEDDDDDDNDNDNTSTSALVSSDMDRVRTIAEQFQSAQPVGFTYDTQTVRTAIPHLLRGGSLREYQHIGLDWLVSLYDNNLNGILADEMGLGKTIQTIALLAYLACEREIWGQHLIVVPASVLVNWEMELKRWLPGMKILAYFGTRQERKRKRRGWSDPDAFNVVITSYQLILQDKHVFKRKAWHYLILDEAQHIKNFASQRWEVLMSFNTYRRLLLTGTPLQNNMMELWSLMHFLMPHVFQSQKEFKEWFNASVEQASEGKKGVEQERMIERLHGVLRPFLLRRLKRDVAKQLPQKFEHIVECRLSRRQRELYEDFMSKSGTVRDLDSGNYFKMMNVVMQLRKVCNHPDLFAGRAIVSSFDMLGPIEYRVPKLVVLDSGSSTNRRNDHLFAHSGTRLPSSMVTPYERMVGALDVDPLTLLNMEVQENMAPFWHAWATREYAELVARRERNAAISGQRCEVPVVYEESALRLLRVRRPDMPWVKLPAQRATEMHDTITNFVCIIPRARAPSLSMVHGRPVDAATVADEQAVRELCVKHSDIYFPSFVRTQLYFPDKRLLQFDCGKLQKLAVLLRRLRSEGHRVLIFSQMTAMLDILEAFLNLYAYTYLRLDGRTKVDMRARLMERYNNDDRIFAFILSTRSGGLGINLTGADTVIFYDNDWNPAIDLQAQDRCHRIGQTREVHIYRLITPNTIEENILRVSNQKREMNNVVIGDGKFSTDFLFDVGRTDVQLAMAQAEDRDDRVAAKRFTEEVQADFAGLVEAPTPAVAGSAAAAAAATTAVAADANAGTGAPATTGVLLEVENYLNAVEKYSLYLAEVVDPVVTADERRVDEEQLRLQELKWERENLARRELMAKTTTLTPSPMNKNKEAATTAATAVVADEKDEDDDAEEESGDEEEIDEREERRLRRQRRQQHLNLSAEEEDQYYYPVNDDDNDGGGYTKKSGGGGGGDDDDEAYRRERLMIKAIEARLDTFETNGFAIEKNHVNNTNHHNTAFAPDELTPARPLDTNTDEWWGLFTTAADLARMLNKRPSFVPSTRIRVRHRINSRGEDVWIVRIPRSLVNGYNVKRSGSNSKSSVITGTSSGPQQAQHTASSSTTNNSQQQQQGGVFGGRSHTKEMKKAMKKVKRTRTVAEESQLKDKVAWTPEEDEVLRDTVNEFGTNWSLCAEMLSVNMLVTGRLRSPDDCKNRYTQIIGGSNSNAQDSGGSGSSSSGNNSRKRKNHGDNNNTNGGGGSGQRVPIGFGSDSFAVYLDRARKGVLDQANACKKAVQRFVEPHQQERIVLTHRQHTSHSSAVQAAHQRLGLPQDAIGKTLMPQMIIRLRAQRFQARQKEESQARGLPKQPQQQRKDDGRPPPPPQQAAAVSSAASSSSTSAPKPKKQRKNAAANHHNSNNVAALMQQGSGSIDLKQYPQLRTQFDVILARQELTGQQKMHIINGLIAQFEQAQRQQQQQLLQQQQQLLQQQQLQQQQQQQQQQYQLQQQQQQQPQQYQPQPQYQPPQQPQPQQYQQPQYVQQPPPPQQQQQQQPQQPQYSTTTM